MAQDLYRIGPKHWTRGDVRLNDSDGKPEYALCSGMALTAGTGTLPLLAQMVICISRTPICLICGFPQVR